MKPSKHDTCILFVFRYVSQRNTCIVMVRGCAGSPRFHGGPTPRSLRSRGSGQVREGLLCTPQVEDGRGGRFRCTRCTYIMPYIMRRYHILYGVRRGVVQAAGWPSLTVGRANGHSQRYIKNGDSRNRPKWAGGGGGVSHKRPPCDIM